MEAYDGILDAVAYKCPHYAKLLKEYRLKLKQLS
jgi:hypothetical protein